MAPTPPKGKHVIYIYIAIAGNFGIAVVKFIAAAITCSSAILSEGIPR
jgi:divalent metal cation (Fe/Co/Zn/Cd) transporter